LDTRERDTGGHNEGGASDHTGGPNQEQGRYSQGHEMQGNRNRFQNKTQNKTQKLWIMTQDAKSTADNTSRYLVVSICPSYRRQTRVI